MRRVLFIDLRNTCRSRMAEAWFNRFAEGWGEAQSCGTMPALGPDPSTITAMAEVGIDIRKSRPKAVDQRLLAQSNMVILMGADVHPGAFSPHQIWDLLDPAGQSLVHYRIQRDAIRERVQELVMQLRRAEVEEARLDPAVAALLDRQVIMEQMFIR